MKIIGFTSHSSGNHDSSVALLIDGKIVFAESEERVSRKKHDSHFPSKALSEVLKKNSLSLKDINYFASGSVPLTQSQILLSYRNGFKHAGIRKTIIWFLTRILLKLTKMDSDKQDNQVNSFSGLGLPKEKLISVSHYLAHAETAYQYCGMNECLVIAWDGYGLDQKGKPLCGSVFKGKNGKLELLEEIPVYTSLGLYYGAVTVSLGFKLNDGEGKTMGLAAFGKKSGALQKLIEFFPYFNGKKWVARKNWLEINGVSRPEYFKLTPSYRYLRGLIEEYGVEQVAWAVQKIFEDEAVKYFKHLIKKYQIRNAAVAGGVFLNVKLNSKLLREKIVEQIFIYPNPGDGGVAVGAAISAYKQLGNEVAIEKMEDAYLGCGFSKKEIKKALSGYKKKIFVKEIKNNLARVVAKEIAAGKVMGWFQGKGEWGPRALGHRSVLADPRKIETKERINSKLKERDWFMPFAPAILSEYAKDYLKNGFGTPFMTLTDDIKPAAAKKIPAAIHIDNTARAQVVFKKENPLYWGVINEFHKITGVPVLLNTSFNRHGLPIVHTPSEAIEHLMWGCIDELVIGDFIVTLKQ